MKKLLFIINPKAGKTAVKNDLFDIIMTFSNAGYEVVTHPTTGPDDAERTVIEEGANYDLIVCAGGDGTIENTVCGYMKMGDKKVPLGYIPAGTTNDFARSLKISRKPSEAAGQIVDGEITHIDVGRMQDKYFIYIAAFGMFTDISYSTKQSLKKVMGHSAYVVEAIKNIANFKSFKLEADFDGKTVTGDYIFGMFTNSFSVAGFKIRGVKHVILDDGKFDCMLVKKPQNPSELQQIISAFLTNDIGDSEMFFRVNASKLKIKSETPIPWTLDGEYGGEYTETEIVVEKQAVGIYTKRPSGIINSGEIAVSEEDFYDDEDCYEEITDGWD